ncbi:MAG: class I tRNA ligase family protein, partial [Patescibacteria group bacterium]
MSKFSENLQKLDLTPHPDFIKIEEDLLDHWYRDGIVEKYLHKNDKSPTKFSFLDGPITANNPMGVHHGRGRSYKDLWQKYHTMKGDRGRYQNGFDCQGLWVEVEVEKELGFKNKKEIMTYGVEKFVQKCRERVLKFAAVQTEQSKRLGMWADWGNDYYTMSDENNYAIWNFLKVCHQRGWVYKGNDSVPWCPRCETAISQHEMLTEDYKQVTHKAVYLELPIEKIDGEFLLIWTTTPWTIPANIAVAVDEKLEYALVKGSTGNNYWVAKDAVERVFGSGHQGIVKTKKGKELLGLKYRGPFDDLPAVKKVAGEFPDKFHTVVPADPLILPITVTEGTGLVHTAVSAGSEDFKLGKKLGLPMIPVIADNADYLEDLGFLSGKNGKKHPELILDYLTERQKTAGEEWIFEIQDYSHRYPACWRCKTELVWKVTDEWYIAMDK